MRRTALIQDKVQGSGYAIARDAVRGNVRFRTLALEGQGKDEGE
ncbi:MAG: hypothetical protein WBG01_10605 [Bacteroidota bacterium]